LPPKRVFIAGIDIKEVPIKEKIETTFALEDSEKIKEINPPVNINIKPVKKKFIISIPDPVLEKQLLQDFYLHPYVTLKNSKNHSVFLYKKKKKGKSISTKFSSL
jgi:hypothetical protein